MNERDFSGKNLKKRRHNAIIRLISDNSVETQGQLTELLISEGFDVTQATVSRDIKELHLIKLADDGDSYRYALPGKENNADIMARYTAVLNHSTITVQNAMNMVVIKTIPGSAQGCAMAIDMLEYDGIIGTIAGDDTVFIAMGDIHAAEALVNRLSKMIIS